MAKTLPRRITGSVLLMIVTSAPIRGQYQIASLEELRREVAAGDLVSIVQTNGDMVKGRLLRVGDGNVDIQPDGRRARLTIPINALNSVERRGDSVRNGLLIGAAVGGIPVLAMFIYALAVDRNELDEWAPVYLGLGAAATGIGALAGTAIDRAHTRPRVKFAVSF